MGGLKKNFLLSEMRRGLRRGLRAHQALLRKMLRRHLPVHGSGDGSEASQRDVDDGIIHLWDCDPANKNQMWRWQASLGLNMLEASPFHAMAGAKS